jgi:hypothetical protein
MGQAHGARREHRAYKYMHIYLCTILTIRFLEVGPARRRAGKEGGQGRIKNQKEVSSD